MTNRLLFDSKYLLAFIIFQDAGILKKEMKISKSLSRDEREKLILKTAFNVFSTYGFRASTTKMLADAAGINEVTLFRNFKSKQNLFKKVIEHYTFLARFEELEPELLTLSLRKALELLAASFLDNLYRNKNLVQIMTMEAYTHQKQAKMIYKNLIEKVFSHFVDYLSNLSGSANFRKFNSQLVARAFFGMFFFYFINQEFFFEKDISKFKKQDVVREYVDLFLKGIDKSER